MGVCPERITVHACSLILSCVFYSWGLLTSTWQSLQDLAIKQEDIFLKDTMIEFQDKIIQFSKLVITVFNVNLFIMYLPLYAYMHTDTVTFE